METRSQRTVRTFPNITRLWRGRTSIQTPNCLTTKSVFVLLQYSSLPAQLMKGARKIKSNQIKGSRIGHAKLCLFGIRIIKKKKKCGEATMVRGHLEYKYWKFVGAIWELSVCARLHFAALNSSLKTFGTSPPVVVKAALLPTVENTVRRALGERETSFCSLNTGVFHFLATYSNNRGLLLLRLQLYVSSPLPKPSSYKDPPQLNLDFIQFISPCLKKQCD